MAKLSNKTKAELLEIINDLETKLSNSNIEISDYPLGGIPQTSTKAKLDTILCFNNNIFDACNFEDIGKILYDCLSKYKRPGNWGTKLGVYDDSTQEYSVVFVHALKNGNSPKLMRCNIKEVGYYSKIVLESKKTLFFPDNHSKESLEIDIRQKSLPRGSLIFIPLLYKEKLVGLFSYSSSPENSIDEEFRFLLEGIGKILSVVLAIHLGIIKSEEKEIDTDELYDGKKYKQLLDSVTDYHYRVILSDGKAINTIHNSSSIIVTGYTPEDFLKDEFLWYKMIYEEDREKVQKFINSIFTEMVSESIEHRIITKNGELKWVRNTIIPEKSESGELIAYDGLLKDITKTKLTEEQIRRSEEKLNKIFNQSLDLLFIVTFSNGIITDINKTALSYFSISKSEAIGKSIIDIGLLDFETFKKIEFEIQRTGIYKSSFNKLEIKGEEFDFDITAEVIEISGKNHILLIVEDRTQQRKMQYELTRIHNLESIGILAGGIAHDFNNILTAILGNISFIKMNMSTTDRLYKFIARAEESCFKARELSNKLLTFSRGGKPQVEIASIEQIVKEYTVLALSGSNTYLNYQEKKPISKVQIDQEQIRQVITSIVENAKEAMPLGGELIVRIEDFTITEKNNLQIPSGEYVKIAFIDHGIGIPQENISKIFDPYFSTKMRGSEKGMGLGLSISYSIIKKHNGYITVTSKVGHGSNFSIYLPAVKET